MPVKDINRPSRTGTVLRRHKSRKKAGSVVHFAAAVYTLVSRLVPGGEIVLAGFYHQPISFAFAPAFMREARLRIAAQFQPADLIAVTALVEADALSLDHLITHHAATGDAAVAYQTAFENAACLKMVIDWSLVS